MFRRLSREEDSQFAAGPDRLPWYVRALLCLFGLGLAAPLGVAVWLTPDPQGKGYGTHEQLGLPPCSFVTKFDMRCPSCGMTTSWAYTVRGRIPSAVEANSGGALLALMALMLTPWSFVSAARGRWLLGCPGHNLVVAAVVVVVAVTLLDWAARLLWE